MKHIVVGDEHYVASEADIKERHHRTPAGTLYHVKMAFGRSQPDIEAEVDILRDIARAENKQWLHRVIWAGVAAGLSSRVLDVVVGLLL